MKSRGHTSSPTPPHLVGKGFSAIHQKRQLKRSGVRRKLLPGSMIEQVCRFDFFLPVEVRLANRHLDHLTSDDVRARPCHSPHSIPLGSAVFLPCAASYEGGRPATQLSGLRVGRLYRWRHTQDTVASTVYFTRLPDGCQALCERHRPCLTGFRIDCTPGKGSSSPAKDRASNSPGRGVRGQRGERFEWRLALCDPPSSLSTAGVCQVENHG